MKIDDEELRTLFKAESEEHLQRLDEGLLRLERHPNDRATLEEVFREAHNLKGAARMLGVADVETVAHRFEDVLGAAKRGQVALTSELVDRLYRGLDGIRRLVEEAVTGRPAEVDVMKLLGGLEEKASPASAKAPADTAVSGPVSKTAQPGKPVRLKKGRRTRDRVALPVAAESSTATIPGDAVVARATIPPSSQGSEVPDAQHRIETIRVDSRKLDLLMTQAGELIVTKIQSGRRVAEISQLLTVREEWHRWLATCQPAAAGGVGAAPNGAVKELAEFHKQERERVEKLGAMLDHLANGAAEDYQRLEFVARGLEGGIYTARLLPLSTVFGLFRRTVRDLGRELSKEVELAIEGENTTADKQIIEEIKDPLMHMIRNAIDHGIERPAERIQAGKPRVGCIRLLAYQTATRVVIEVVDDGCGLDVEAIKRTALNRRLCSEEELAAMPLAQVQSLIFTPGFSTRSIVSDLSGRGVGMDVVRAAADRLKGTIHIDSTPGCGCTIQMQFPVTLATMRVLIATVDRHAYAIPVEYIQTMRFVRPSDVYTVGGHDAITLDGHAVPLVHLTELLGQGDGASGRSRAKRPGAVEEPVPGVVLAVAGEKVCCLADALLEEQEVVLKRHGPVLRRVRNVSGATILGTGEVCIILNPQDIVQAVRRQPAVSQAASPRLTETRKRTILVVEDSIAYRIQQKRMLEVAGYDVVVAVDGVEALEKLRAGSVDAIVSDIEMPNMDGVALTETIRHDRQYADLPVILVSSLTTDEAIRRGKDAGANAYFTKPILDEERFLDALKRLV